MITFDDFKKIDLRVAKIIRAEKIEGSEKLLKLQVDLGSEQRQVIAGIGKQYTPEALVGKEIVVVVNLEPRLIFGLESQAMLLAAQGDGPVILIPEKEVAAGAGVR